MRQNSRNGFKVGHLAPRQAVVVAVVHARRSSKRGRVVPAGAEGGGWHPDQIIRNNWPPRQVMSLVQTLYLSENESEPVQKCFRSPRPLPRNRCGTLAAGSSERASAIDRFMRERDGRRKCRRKVNHDGRAMTAKQASHAFRCRVSSRWCGFAAGTFCTLSHVYG